MTHRTVEIAQIMRKLRNRHVQTERDQELQAALHSLFEVGEDGMITAEPVRFTAGQETNGITLIEGAGGGKTTAIFKVLEDFAPLAENPATGAARRVYVKVEAPATLRSVGATFLRQLGIDHVSDRTKVYDIWNMVRTRLQIMGISLVWIDEAQDLFRSTTAAETDTVFRMLKGLMQGENPVVLILSGTERLGEMTGIDPQVDRRFLKIRPTDLAFGADNEMVMMLVESYAKLAGLRVNIEADVINRLIYGARYRFGRVIVNLVEAIEVALLEGSEALTVDHFASAWARREGCEITHNVFWQEDFTSIDIGLDDWRQVLPETPVKKTRGRKKAA